MSLENVILRVKSTDDMTRVGKKTADLLNENLSVSDDTMKYKAEDLLEQAKEIQELSDSTNSMLIWIAGISLLVGGIGVMNIMLVSVTERTSENRSEKSTRSKKRHYFGTVFNRVRSADQSGWNFWRDHRDHTGTGHFESK